MTGHTRYYNVWPDANKPCIQSKSPAPVAFMGIRSRMQMLYRNQPQSKLDIMKAELLRISKEGGAAANIDNWLDLCGATPPPPIVGFDSTTETWDSNVLTWDSTT